MARKEKKQGASKVLTAPFFMLTFGDMMSLLLTFFILLFSMSTIEVIKFQAQIGAIQGALGISEMFSHAPMLKDLPSPSVTQNTRIIARSTVKPSSLKPVAKYKRIDLTEPVQHEENDKIKQIQFFGTQGDISISAKKDEVLIILPTYDVFTKGSYSVDASSENVQKVIPLYRELAKQMASLVDYDIYFTGHTDALPLVIKPGSVVNNNTELGFYRAIAIYNFFFSKYLPDKSRIIFSSQGDNVPIIPNARLDSERRVNRRVEIILKKRK